MTSITATRLPADWSNFDDLLGSDSALDRPLYLTVFINAKAQTQKRHTRSLRMLAQEVHRPMKSTKAELPLLKLARFGDNATEAGCLRQNDNMEAVDGLEGDYDGGVVSLADGAERVRAAGIAALLYTSPSHTPERPKWRVLCPLSSAAPPAERERLCARLNGALNGILAGESFTASQSYYFGAVTGGSTPEMALIEGRALDVAAELDDGALGKGGLPYRVEDRAAPAAANDDPADWPRIDAALATINVIDGDTQEAGGRDLYLRVGQALHHAAGGGEAGRERWEAWARGGAKFNARDLARDWKSFGRRSTARPVTAASLFDTAARQYGWQDPGHTFTGDDFDPLPPIAEKPTKAPRLRFLAPTDCANAARRGYVVKGLLAPGDLACIFGAPGAGKSLIAPHLAYRLAQGLPAFGMRTKPGPVFYVAAEDPHGMRGRVTALRIRHGDAAAFRLVEGVSDLFAPAADDLEALRDAVEEQRPSLVIIDTLAMAFPGLEENAAESMTRVVTIGRKLTAHGAAVVLVHHDTKAQGPTPRGHSVLNGALDVALQLFPRDEAGVVRGKLTKNRNGSCERDIAFRISTEALGCDEDGDPVTAALVDELPAGAAPSREKLTPSERAAFVIFDALSAAGAVTEDAWRTACIEARTVSASPDRESRRKATKRAFEGLARKGAVLMGDGMARRPGSFGNAFDEDEDD